MYRLRTLGGFSIEQDGVVLDRIRVYRKAHALLAVLAANGGTSRERLMSLLWPESDTGRAKGSLKQTIHLLRRQFAASDLLLGTAELRLNPERITSDVESFRSALEAGDSAAAARVYGGAFLDGVYLDRSAEFEQWVAAQRVELGRKYMGALEKLARAAEAQGDHVAAAEWWRRLQASDPLNSRLAVNLMLALEAAGDRAGALQHARIHETLVAEEWSMPPDPAVGALAERLRAQPPRAPGPVLPADTAPAAPATMPTPAESVAPGPIPAPAAPATMPTPADSLAPGPIPAPATATGVADAAAKTVSGTTSSGTTSSGSGPGAGAGARRVWRRPAATGAAAVLVLAVGYVVGMFGQRDQVQTAEALTQVSASPRSLVASRFYEEGLRSIAVADYRTAERLLAAAVDEDSMFAMAAHYLWGARAALHVAVPDTARARLLRLAERAPEHEGLLMRATWDTRLNAQEQLAWAETLVVRFPDAADGHLLLAARRTEAGDFLAALQHLRRVVAIDSLGLRGIRPHCRGCNAYAGMITAYLNADSVAAAERSAREWLRYQPRSAWAWATLATALELQGRQEDALAARRTAASLNPIDYNDALAPAMARIRSGDFATADRLLLDLVRDGTPEVQREASWWLVISLRHQGRLREALAGIRGLPHDSSTGMMFPVRLLEGQVLFELGDFAEAARVFLAASQLPPDDARRQSWALTHHATALAAAGDTARLAALAETVEALGRQSSFSRDWRLHHHVRGLLLAARGRTEQAAAEFRRAVVSATYGYTRTNLELARVLLGSRQPQEAVAILQPAFRGSLESSNLYVTHSELHALLGDAWEAAGRADSAAVHYRRALDAWRDADPELHVRRDALRARLAVTRGPD